ncbi:hypothetical protein CLAFUW4_08321 [Fulvia fulva]|uniref:Uncharacterized protein n=1 Tax=Passalora fulva TaxID=5499 RepID=A0A9Q8LDV4_PASFU|nr:uncharacterized protein CLAFUR5_08429 [Fulvia fulva]KAK4629111.1 hypothetical protein CLAFUR4_08326 [Fulvia fulva]KAK4630801.1 hypothetical protein CLAFUR0_08321 [Fulvia fulva]UJO15414.1 hypothetical protein CLAFUR5_08429 [Fulvia fulva]WPV12077.1 hypothetical protein CLAFUW4_08321 [Fulvia fulva]WPV27327.1 hypothetical protein CLAFUW7_08321 [Fulvia fulva]
MLITKWQILRSQPTHVYLVLVLVTALPLYYGSYQYRLRHPYGSPTQSSGRMPTGNFVADWTDTQVVAPFNQYPVASFCNRTTHWRPNLVFNLANADGQIADVRGNVLDFLFYAIEAGASIMLPGIPQQNEGGTGNVNARKTDFAEFFDEKWFLKTMEETCPQMQIYKMQEGQELKAALPDYYKPRTRRMDEGFNNNRKAYLSDLESWLQARRVLDDKSTKFTVVNVKPTLYNIDTRSLPHGLRRNFGQVLRVNPEIRRLAAMAVEQLRIQYGLEIDSTQPIPRNAFYAVYLPDPSDTNLTTAYLSHAKAHNLDTLYIATPDPSDLSHLKLLGLSQPSPLTLLSASDLLPEIEQPLSPAEQALVDYSITLRASVFGGMVKSSLSAQVAMTRNQWVEDRGVVVDPERVRHAEEGMWWDDGWSRVVGRIDEDGSREGAEGWGRGVWP